MAEVLRPATLTLAEDGTPWSADYGDVYHAAAGGPGQAEHVFLRGNGLPERWAKAERFVILETGFGTGLNFLATWAAWRAAPRKPARLHYLAAEKHPFGVDDLARLHARWPAFADLAAELRAAWPSLVPGYHRLELGAGQIVLTLLFGDAATTLARLSARVDAFYLDGFAPPRNPEMWTPELCARLARLAAPEATLATWSVAGAVRAALSEAGFSIEKRPGFGPKRDMLVGRYAPPAYRPVQAMPEVPRARHAIVIGAGLAGTACCERLAARGWTVDLLERHATPAGEASGNLIGIHHPLLARDDNIQARLTRAAFLHGPRLWRRMRAAGHDFPWSDDGLLQLARDSEHAALQRALPEALAYPEAYARFLELTDIARQFGCATPMGGWLIQAGGWANPSGLCQAYLGMAGAAVRAQHGVEVAALRQEDGVWRVMDDAGRRLAEAPCLILANGLGARRLTAAAHLPMQALRGQVTLIPEGRIAAPRLPICREGYVTPALRGWHCAGASYDGDDEATPRRASDLGNLARLARLLDGLPDLNADTDLASRVGFRAVPPDRLPLVGALPDAEKAPGSGATQLAQLPRLAGVQCLLGYASRGIIWSSLLAEVLVSALEGEPAPIERDLLDAVDPGRFMLKRLRKNKGPA
jgi:tRNA 5-methylaminomethyl-2-thiouridine biosynthesis bifunctional protein